jgi:hypothetical protein
MGNEHILYYDPKKIFLRTPRQEAIILLNLCYADMAKQILMK